MRALTISRSTPHIQPVLRFGIGFQPVTCLCGIGAWPVRPLFLGSELKVANIAIFWWTVIGNLAHLNRGCVGGVARRC
jgi:hypothetical protein